MRPRVTKPRPRAGSAVAPALPGRWVQAAQDRQGLKRGQPAPPAGHLCVCHTSGGIWCQPPKPKCLRFLVCKHGVIIILALPRGTNARIIRVNVCKAFRMAPGT